VERYALTNGNQRRTAIGVALANGIGVRRYVALLSDATLGRYPGLGVTVEQRRSNARHLVREGVITSENVDLFIEGAHVVPIDAG